LPEQHFHKIETGQSYSLKFINDEKTQKNELSQNSQNSYHIKSTENLAFFENIDILAQSAGNGFYKQISEFIKNAKCPIIISCEKIPFGLAKLCEICDFLFVNSDKENYWIYKEYCKIIYLLEKMQIDKIFQENTHKIEEIGENFEKNLLELKENIDLSKIYKPIENSQYNLCKFLQKLYFENTDNLQENLFENNIEIIDILLENNSITNSIDFYKNTENLLSKSYKSAQNLLFSLNIEKVNKNEYPIIFELLNVFY